MAVTGLIEQITKLENLETKIDAIHAEITTGKLAVKLSAATTCGDRPNWLA